jgi:hypothetical protein
MKETLKETLAAIRDDSLPLPMLEKYRDDLIHFKTDYLKLQATLKKKKALFLMEEPDKSAIARKLAFEASEDGQRLIDIDADLRGLPDEIDALMSRIYAAIR